MTTWRKLSARSSWLTRHLCLTLAAALALPAVSCKSAETHSITAAVASAGDLNQQCSALIAEMRQASGGDGGRSLSESSVYQALFQQFAATPVKLDQRRTAYLGILWGMFQATYFNFGSSVDPKVAPHAREVQNLLAFHVGLLTDEQIGSNEALKRREQSLLGNNFLGLMAFAAPGNDERFPQRLESQLTTWQKSRGIQLDGLLALYMMDRYPEVFHIAYFKQQGLMRGLTPQTPGELFVNKTTPNLFCNNVAAALTTTSIPWKDLGMDAYTGLGYLSWLQGPIAEFHYEHPVIFGLIPVLGSAWAAADDLATLYEGRDASGNDASRMHASVSFVANFVMAVMDAYAVKAAAQKAGDFAKRVTARLRGMPEGASPEYVRAVLGDEVMSSEARLEGPSLGTCLTDRGGGFQRWLRHGFGIVGTAYALSSGLPCIGGIQDAEKLHQNITNTERVELLKDVPVETIMSAPGHKYLRSPQNIPGIAETILAGGARPDNEPIVILASTQTLDDGHVGVRALEFGDGNHWAGAMVYIEDGIRDGTIPLEKVKSPSLRAAFDAIKGGRPLTIGDVDPRNFKVLVNGWESADRGGHLLPRWIPYDIAAKSNLPKEQWFRVPAEWGAKGPTAQIPGYIASIDEVFPADLRGVAMRDVLDTSLKTIQGGAAAVAH